MAPSIAQIVTALGISRQSYFAGPGWDFALLFAVTQPQRDSCIFVKVNGPIQRSNAECQELREPKRRTFEEGILAGVPTCVYLYDPMHCALLLHTTANGDPKEEGKT